MNLQTAPGKATIARLMRTEGRYRMTIASAEFVQLPKERRPRPPKSGPCFRQTSFDHQYFIQRFDANHCHAVYGDWVEDLVMIAEMLGIDVEILGE